MDEDKKKHQWRLKFGLEKELKPIIILRSDIGKRTGRKKIRKKIQ